MNRVAAIGRVIIVSLAFMWVSKLTFDRVEGPWHHTQHAQHVNATVQRMVSVHRMSTHNGSEVRESLVVPLLTYTLPDGKSYECTYIDHTFTREEFELLKQGATLSPRVDPHLPTKCWSPDLSEDDTAMKMWLAGYALISLLLGSMLIFQIKRLRTM